MQARKPKKARSSVRSSKREPLSCGRAVIEDPLEYLLDLMVDDRLSRMQQGAIAQKLAPYFHPKPKPVPGEYADQIWASLFNEQPRDPDDQERRAAERVRHRIFDL
jgi:hypothetical protein